MTKFVDILTEVQKYAIKGYPEGRFFVSRLTADSEEELFLYNRNKYNFADFYMAKEWNHNRSYEHINFVLIRQKVDYNNDFFFKNMELAFPHQLYPLDKDFFKILQNYREENGEYKISLPMKFLIPFPVNLDKSQFLNGQETIK